MDYTKSIEMRLVEQLVGFKTKTASKTEFGLSDIELGLKIQVLKKENINTEIAFISHLIIPSWFIRIDKYKLWNN